MLLANAEVLARLSCDPKPVRMVRSLLVEPLKSPLDLSSYEVLSAVTAVALSSRRQNDGSSLLVKA